VVYYKSPRWEVIATKNNISSILEQVSFVNGIWTIKGGKHVDYIVNQIVKNMSELIMKKNKGMVVKPQHIKDNMFIFINSIIVNPTFDSQTKDYLTTPVSKFGSKCELNTDFYNKLYKSSLTDSIIEVSNLHADKTLSKTDGKKQNRIYGLTKLDDANWAGTKKSNLCTLILTEGDSAKTTAVSGLSVVGRDKYGVFPLKGKLLNVNGLTSAVISKNEEIANIKKIMGLESGKTYTDTNQLRYGKIMCLCDADEDGHHIKGLLFNLFNTLFPSLIKIDGFMCSMLTPIIKATKGTQIISFYSISDYKQWKDSTDLKGWTIKYYKGLGTSTAKEAKEYFKEMKRIEYISTKDDKSKVHILDLTFNKKRANDRKDWLLTYDKDATLDYNKKQVTYDDFINLEMKHFSFYDTSRSLPSLCDGLKISTRKILYSCLKRHLVKEIKVAQLGAFVAEQTNYHHGEKCLEETIVGMAQDFVGSNNLAFFTQDGQFGTRNTIKWQ